MMLNSLSDPGFVRRQKFRLGEYRRRRYRDQRFEEAARADGPIGRAPDYVGVGVQRAGTSRWHELLTAHPDVAEVTDPSGRRVKEIHWFEDPLAQDSHARDHAYHSWFQAPSHMVVGEWTPRYLFDLWPLDRLRASSPDTKLIVMLREPMDRLQSALQFYAARGVPLDRDTVREAIWRGMYGAQLGHLFEQWPREQVFVGLFERGVEEPEDLLADLYRFLGLDPSFVPPDLNRRVNESRPASMDPSLVLVAQSLYRRDRPRVEALLPETALSHWW